MTSFTRDSTGTSAIIAADRVICVCKKISFGASNREEYVRTTLADSHLMKTEAWAGFIKAYQCIGCQMTWLRKIGCDLPVTDPTPTKCMCFLVSSVLICLILWIFDPLDLGSLSLVLGSRLIELCSVLKPHFLP